MIIFGAKCEQDNSIERIENLTRLRSLEYLNLSMNSIERIEGLETCEALERLDLTLNFIGDGITRGLTHLAKWNPNLRELTLTGNPCWKYVCSLREGSLIMTLKCFPGSRDTATSSSPCSPASTTSTAATSSTGSESARFSGWKSCDP